MPEEIRLRLLLRAIDRFGHEGPAELGKIEHRDHLVDAEPVQFAAVAVEDTLPPAL